MQKKLLNEKVRARLNFKKFLILASINFIVQQGIWREAL